jgi:hypothetical protein
MSHQKEDRSDEKQGGVQINDLPQKEEELQPDEAKNVKGGGGLTGGVVGSRSKGEEIPS